MAALSFDGGGMSCRSFSVGESEELDRWATETNKKANLYFHVNRIAAGVEKKARLEDVEEVSWLHVDSDVTPTPAGVDAAEWLGRERERILEEFRRARVPLTLIVFSGGGYQGYYKLKQPIAVCRDKEKARLATLYNRELVRLFAGSDNCQSVEHVMRLVGTVNWPGEKKLARNPTRVAQQAEVVSWLEGEGYDLSVFRPAAGEAEKDGPVKYTAKVGENVARVDDVRNDQRLAKVSDKTKALLVSGENLDKDYGSRSEAQWHVSCELVRAGVDDETHFALLTDADLWIGQAVLQEKGGRERKGWRRYAIRQIEKAHEATQAEADFIRDDKGFPNPTLYKNCRLAIQALGVHLSYDEFANEHLVEGLDDFGPYLDDSVEIRLHSMAQAAFGITFRLELWRRAVTDTAMYNRFHPVRDYLRGLQWDGVKRVDSWLADYCGAPDDAWTREVGRLFMVAAVRRIMEPGCKFDFMTVLVGPQGRGKSSVLAALTRDANWFQDNVSFGRQGAKDIVESTLGRWICEVGELNAMKRADMDHVKNLLSSQVDKTRLSYERQVRTFPRQCVFVGTTNERKFLTDVTGNRRFWPVMINEILVDKIKADRDQLWAEAFARREESIQMPESMWPEATQRQEDTRVVDPFETVLEEGLEGLSGVVKPTTLYEFLKVPQERWTQGISRQVAGIMHRLGWEPIVVRLQHDGMKKLCRVWARGDRSKVVTICAQGLGYESAF